MNKYKFEKLEVWQKASSFVTDIYKITLKFPKTEQFGLTDQLRRAAISIVLNIAEGSGAGSDLEFIRFLRISQRSCFEVIAGLQIALNLKFLRDEDFNLVAEECNSISAMLGGLIRRLRNDHEVEKRKASD